MLLSSHALRAHRVPPTARARWGLEATSPERSSGDACRPFPEVRLAPFGETSDTLCSVPVTRCRCKRQLHVQLQTYGVHCTCNVQQGGATPCGQGKHRLGRRLPDQADPIG
jgi:hypothetical protein